jgi:hypothetical protein
MSVFNSVLTSADIEYIFSLPEVQTAKRKIDSCENGKIYFSIELNDSIRSALNSRFGIDFSSVSNIPMRWIKGDTSPHIDTGASAFENTYLVYLIGDESHMITQNTGFMFQEGISHRTLNTGSEPRLLLGPMNEFAEPVGASPGIYYYSTQADANNANSDNTGFSIAGGGYLVYTVGTINYGSVGSYTSWRIASSSTGSSSQAVVYVNGDILDSGGDTSFYFLYPAAPCFLEGTEVLCQVDGIEKYVSVESLEKGTLVKTSLNGYKAVQVIGHGTLQNPGDDTRLENRLYKCSPSKYPELTADLYITGCHSILEFPLTDKQKEDTLKRVGKMYITDKKYRLMACDDERAEPWNSEGIYNIYHFALENEDDGLNYGVYVNGGLLVETCAIRTLLNRTNMILK